MHDQLLAAIKARQSNGAEFNYGILTADRYVKSVRDCVGSDLCYRYASTKANSFEDVLKKAARTLTYNNPDMVKEIDLPLVNGVDYEVHGQKLELPKNTLMVFRHVLTTPRKDRDGDILRTKGAKPDPKMPLLWQHVHTLPIGKMLSVVEHTPKKLSVISAIVDINELAHDAAVMVDNKMGRFSHGFRALDFSDMKEEDGRTSGKGGFDVKEFEILEESLVSVPSNVDAETEELILSLVSGGKLTSPMMKGVGMSIKEKTPKQFAVGGLPAIPLNIDLNLTLNGKAIDDGEIEEKSKEGCQCSGSPEKADEADDEREKPNDKEMKCPECGGMMKDGKCSKCGYTASEKKASKEEVCKCGGKMVDGVCEKCGMKADKKEVDQANADAHNDMGPVVCPKCGITSALVDGKCPKCGYNPSKKSIEDAVKAGRVLSMRNYTAISTVKKAMEGVDSTEMLLTNNGRKSVREGIKTLTDVIGSSGIIEETGVQQITVKDAMATVIAKADQSQRKHMIDVLQTLCNAELRTKRTEQYQKVRSSF